MKKAAAKKEVFEEQEVLQAVVICGESSYSLLPLVNNFPTCLLPLGGITPIELTLSALTRSGFQRVLLYLVSHANRIRAHLRERGWKLIDSDANANANVKIDGKVGLQIEVHELDGENPNEYSKLSAVGDVLRDVYSRELLKSTRGSFLLLSGDIVTNLDLHNLLDLHKKVSGELDRDCVVSVAVRELPTASAEYDADTLIISDNRGKLFAYEPRIVTDSLDEDADVSEKNTTAADALAIETKLRRSCVLNETGASLRLRSNVVRTDIYCCANLVPSLFADNYDYVSMTDLIAGLIEHEETQQYAAYVNVLNGGLAMRISSARRSFGSSISVGRLLRTGYAYPFTSGSNFLLPNSSTFGIVSKPKGSRIRDSFVHKTASIGESCAVLDSVVSERVSVGAGCFIDQAIILADSVIQPNCVVQSMIGEKVQIGSGSIVEAECVLDKEVRIGANCKVPFGTRLTTDSSNLPYSVRHHDRLVKLMHELFGADSNCFVFSGPLVQKAMEAAGSDLLSGDNSGDEIFELEKSRASLRSLLERHWSADKSNRTLVAALVRPPRSFGAFQTSYSQPDKETQRNIAQYVATYCDLIASPADDYEELPDDVESPVSISASSSSDEEEDPVVMPAALSTPHPTPAGATSGSGPVARAGRTPGENVDKPGCPPALERSTSNSPLSQLFDANNECRGCFEELLSTLDRACTDKISNDNLVVEINGLKHAYGLPIRDLRTLLSYSMLECVVASPLRADAAGRQRGGAEAQNSGKSTWPQAKSLLERWLPILVKYIGEADDSQMTLLRAIAACTIESEPYCKQAHLLGVHANELVHFLYENNVLEEDAIVTWWKSLPDEAAAKGKLAKFANWLMEAQEESSDSDD